MNKSNNNKLVSENKPEGFNDYLLVNWPDINKNIVNENSNKFKLITNNTIFCNICNKENNIKSLNIESNTLSCVDCNNSYSFNIINCDICMKNTYAIKIRNEYYICSCGIQYIIKNENKKRINV